MLPQALVEDADACRRKMDNATALIEGLSGERTRWTEACKTFDEQTRCLVGDVLIATGFLSYAGPFNQEFRSQMLRNWNSAIIKNKIPHSHVSSFSY
jgi:dynein heavy chain